MKFLLIALMAVTMTSGVAMADSGDGSASHRTHRVGGFNGDNARVYRNYMDVYQAPITSVPVPTSTITFRDSDRVVIRDYMVEHYNTTCPERAGRDRPGCLPKNLDARYRRGDVLTKRVVYQPLPDEVITRIAPAPTGHRYVVVDGDVMLISDDRHIVDTFTWYPAN